MSETVALFNPDGSVLTVVQTTAAMVITGYAIAGAAAALSATDTLNVALGKLEKRIAVLEAA
jgi:enoyl-[acyl-carrier-protein] reductase (NADH)